MSEKKFKVTKKGVCIGGSILLGIASIFLGLLQGQVEDETIKSSVASEVAKQLSEPKVTDITGE